MGRAGVTHGYKERVGRGLRHALWREVGRPGRDQRRPQDAAIRAVACGEQASCGSDSRECFRKTAIGRAAARPEGNRLAAALGGARPDPSRVRRTVSVAATDCGCAARADRARARHHQQSRSQRIQAPTGRSRPEGHNQSVRHRPALSNRPKVLRMKKLFLQPTTYDLRFWLALLAVLVLAVSSSSQPPPRERVGIQLDATFLLNSGWRVKPTGQQIPLDTFPMSAVVTQNDRFMIVMNAGYKPPSLTVVDLQGGRAVRHVPVPDAWLGMALSPQGKTLWVSGGSTASIYEFTFNDEGVLEPSRTFEFVPVLERTWQDFIGDVAV